jgi:hypothetical protein
MNPINDRYIQTLHNLFSQHPLPKKIKLKSWFATYLDTFIPTIVEDPSQNEIAKAAGVTGRWDGIPIEIDDTIENEYYELVYEESEYEPKI